jgi:dienelactone hydrolase
MRNLLFFFLLILTTMTASAEMVTRTVEYNHGDVKLEGYLAYDNSLSGQRPGVLVVHEWKGLNDYAKMRTEKLAELGYIAFALDMYGKGIRPQTNQEAAQQAGIYRGDRKLMRDRAKAGLDILVGHELCDPNRVAAIGYCFGGGTVLELARGGADISGAVSFHGNLDTPDPNDAKNIKASILVLHGAADPHVPAEQIKAFQDEMHEANVDWQMIEYGGAVHSFTNPESGNDPSQGVAYDARADKRSWLAMRMFFDEIFGR